jgi:hypothetical protein
MNTYKFKINAVDAHVSQDGLDNVIYNVHYSYIGEDENGNVATQIGVQHVPNVNPENFVSFDKLTQADVISWIEAVLPIEEFQSNLDNQLAELSAPTKVTLSVPESIEVVDEETIESNEEI